MAWKEDTYFYSIDGLKIVAEFYLDESGDLSLAEYRADFNRALNHLSLTEKKIILECLRSGGFDDAEPVFQAMADFLNGAG
jgi:hypothetical protein|tara:strand:+ start:2331 stop:2573 length:243 start_codon:yes stop_codon:yes gene_type:complete